MKTLFNKKNEEKYNELLERKQELLSQIEELKEKEQLNIAQSSMRERRKTFYRKLPLEWMHSIYYSCVDRLKELSSSTLSPYDTEYALEKMHASRTEGKNDIQYYALLCESYVQTAEGIVLILRDPYRMVTTQPLKKVSVQKAEEWMDYILIVKVRLSDTMERDFHTIFVERIKQTRYRKDGMADKEGNIKKIKNVAFELFERDWVRGTDACRKELDVIKNRAEANGWDFIPNYGDSDEVFCCIKRPYRFQIIVRPYASNIEIVWEHNVNVSHADVEDFRKTYHKRKDIDPNASLVDQYMGMITGETKGFSLVFLYSCSAAREASMLPSLIVE